MNYVGPLVMRQDPIDFDKLDHSESVGECTMDAYFSADVETDGPIPGPYSILSFALVYAGASDGATFQRPDNFDNCFYRELKPISDKFDPEALQVNGLDRTRLCIEGSDPVAAITEAAKWVKSIAGGRKAVLAAYPLSFDWSWLYWYFVQFGKDGSPFGHSRCFDIKTAFAVKGRVPFSRAGRSRVPKNLRSTRDHTHNALDDAIEQAELFANIFEWDGSDGGN